MLVLKSSRYFIFYTAFVYIQDVAARVNPKSVNLELETSLLFDPKDGSDHSISDVKDFILRLQSLLSPIKALLVPKKHKISDVIENIAMRVNNYDDKDFDKIGRALINQVDKRLTSNKHISVQLGGKYRTIINYILENPSLIRLHTRKSANSKNYKAIKVLLSKLDKYYDGSDVKKLKKIVEKLDSGVPKSNEDVETLVKNALDVVVFDKYKNLNNTQKSQLFSELLRMQKYLKIKMRKENNDMQSVEEAPKYGDNERSETPLSIEYKNNEKSNKTDGDIILDKNIEILIENDDLRSE